MPSLQQLIQSIDRRIDELNSEITSLEAARSALTVNGAGQTAFSTAESRPKPKQRRRRARARKPGTAETAASSPKPNQRRRRTRARKLVTAETAEQLLNHSDGLTTTALAEQAGADRDHMLALLRELEQARRVRRIGQRRATRWHAITDEDRIRERAAELASRSKNRRTRN